MSSSSNRDVLKAMNANRDRDTVLVEDMDFMEMGPDFQRYEARVVELINFIKKKLGKIKGRVSSSSSSSDFAWWKGDMGYYYTSFEITIPREECRFVKLEDKNFVSFGGPSGKYAFIRGTFAHQSLIYAKYKILKETYPRMSRVVNPKILGAI